MDDYLEVFSKIKSCGSNTRVVSGIPRGVITLDRPPHSPAYAGLLQLDNGFIYFGGHYSASEMGLVALLKTASELEESVEITGNLSIEGSSRLTLGFIDFVRFRNVIYNLTAVE